MATFNWPGFGIASVAATLDQPAQVNRSAYTGVRAVASIPWHGKWSFKVQLAVRQGDANFRATRAFFTGLQGQINNFHLPAVEQSQNTNSGVTLSASAAQGATSLALTGVGTALVAGNMATIAGQLISITSVGALSGVAQTISFQPGLRAAAALGASVETSRPYALVALTGSAFSWDIAQWRQYGVMFEADEAIGDTDGASPSGDIWTGDVPSPYASVAAALDFKAGQYWSGGVKAASLSAMPGYTYARSGAKSELNGTASPVAFAANVPGIVTGLGYASRGALTNSFLQSQSFDAAIWSKTAISVTANTVAAPDGTTTAETLTTSGTATANYVFQSDGLTGLTTYSTYLKAGTGRYVQLAHVNLATTYANFDLVSGVVGTVGSGITNAYIINAGSGWYRCVIVFTVAAAASLAIAPVATSSAGFLAAYTATVDTNYIWQAQSIPGSFPDGGPIIVTTTVTASIGADALAVGVANGTYNATYTFDDLTTQVIATTIAGGSFSMPVNPATLNRPIVQKVVLV